MIQFICIAREQKQVQKDYEFSTPSVASAVILGSWHIYGHIHGRKDDVYEFMKTRPTALNAGACINNYTPASLNELIRNNAAFQAQ